MKTSTPPRKSRDGAGMSDDAVRAATGKDWGEWTRTLDRAGAPKMTHAQIAAMLADRFGVRPWWSQMVTVGYERLTGRREKHETKAGYQVSVSRTLAIATEKCELAWRDARRRKAWLPEKIAVRASSSPGVIRFAWQDGSDIEVRLTTKGDAKVQVVVQASKLAGAAAAANAKQLWRDRLASMGDALLA
jgi:hypothetical protein